MTLQESSTSSAIHTAINEATCAAVSGPSTTLLKTCVITAEVGGRRQRARALTSHLTFVSSHLVNSFKAMKIPAVTLVSGIEQTTAPASKFKVDLTLHTTYDESLLTINVGAAVVDTITGNLPEKALPGIKQRLFLERLQLADFDFDKPGRIDLLLGRNFLNKVLLDGRSMSEDGELCAYRTIYVW